MTDEEIGADVRARAAEFCRALNLAGAAGLQIEVRFSHTMHETLVDGSTKATGWYSGTELRRIQRV